MFAYFLAYNRYLNIVGIFAVIIVAYFFSQSRKAINVRVICSALLLQFLCAVAMLRTTIGKTIMMTIARGAENLALFADRSVEFMFGRLGDASMPWGFIFAIKVFPIIIFIGALMSLLYHLHIIQKLILLLNAIIRPILGTSGTETMSAIANSILGQTEASLFMGNYIHVMTRSELFVLMASGMSAISISVLVMYTRLGLPGIHLLTASVMSIPASIFIAKILLPETEQSISAGNPELQFEKKSANIFDAIARGTMQGVKLAVAVAAMLISFLALLELLNFLLMTGSSYINYFLELLHIHIRLPAFTLASLLSYIFAPFAYFLGLTGSEFWQAGKLLGIKVSLNELVAFQELMKSSFSERSFLIMLYALCGFSNFSCIGIQIGMITALAPEKRHTVTQLGLYTVLASSLANMLSALMVGLIL